MAKKYWTFKGQKIPVKKTSINKKITANTEFNKVIRLTGRVNKRINDINIQYGKESWATKNLISRLSVKGIDVVRGGKIKIPKNLSPQKLKLVESALNKFLNMKTSSVKGIKDTIKRQQKNIQISLSDEELQITNKEAETLYSFFEDRDFGMITQILNIDPSDLWNILAQAKERNASESSFIKMIEQYTINGVDEDMKIALSNIYNKYVQV